jgi:uncharacterized protein (DUF4415 family)
MAMKKSAASSRRGRRIEKSEEDIRAYVKSPQAKAFSERLKQMKDSEIDYSAIPAATDKELAMFRPVKKPITARVDLDVLAWLKSKGGRYQTHLNSELRKSMMAEMRERNKAAASPR